MPRTSLSPSSTTSEVRQACALTEIKCTRCHTLGRILAADATTREQWEPIVLRMHRMASSGITSHDTDAILTCLSSRH